MLFPSANPDHPKCGPGLERGLVTCVSQTDSRIDRVETKSMESVEDDIQTGRREDHSVSLETRDRAGLVGSADSFIY